MSTASLTTISAQVFDLLNPLESSDRHKVVASVFALLGETPLAAPKTNGPAGGGITPTGDVQLGDHDLGANARRWLSHNALTQDMLEQVFHFDDSGVTVIAATIPGKAKKEQTINAYMLAGARSLLATDKSNFDDKDALSLCKNLGCYDENNHTTNRNALANRVVGDRKKGFSLPAPGLKAAADVVRQIAGGASE